MGYKEFLQSLRPSSMPPSFAEQIRSMLAGALSVLLLGLALEALPHPYFPLLMLGSVGATVVLLFAVPHSPMSQPWALVGGHLVSALAGWLCSLLISETVMAASCAVGLSIFLMFRLRCLHPPGAATALIMTLGAAHFHAMGWLWTSGIIAANIGILLLLALAFNNLLPGRRYPMHPARFASHTSPITAIEHSDLEWAVAQMDSQLDISEDDLVQIYELATRHARGRHQHGQ